MTGAFADTLSFFRFGTWTDMSVDAWMEEIYVGIDAVDDGDEQRGLDEEASTVCEERYNPFFANFKFEKNDAGNREYVRTAEISNPRHFYNIRYYEDFELATLGIENPPTDYYHFRMTFRLTQDINWETFAKTSYYATPNKVVHVDCDENHRAKDFGFPSIRQLRSHKIKNNRKLSEYNWIITYLYYTLSTTKSFIFR